MDSYFDASIYFDDNCDEIVSFSVEPSQPMSLTAKPSHVSKSLFRCTNPTCKKTFLYQSELNRHIQTHSNSRPHICPHPGCGKGFKRFDTLQTHYRLHTGEKPFVCDNPICGMSFSTKAALRYHSLKHSTDKLYKCDVPECGKSFLTQGQLKQHEKGKCHCAKAFFLENSSEYSSVVTKTTSTDLLFSLTAQNSMTKAPSTHMSETSAFSDEYSLAEEEPNIMKKLNKLFNPSGFTFNNIDMDF